MSILNNKNPGFVCSTWALTTAVLYKNSQPLWIRILQHQPSPSPAPASLFLNQSPTTAVEESSGSRSQDRTCRFPAGRLQIMQHAVITSKIKAKSQKPLFSRTVSHQLDKAHIWLRAGLCCSSKQSAPASPLRPVLHTACNPAMGASWGCSQLLHPPLCNSPSWTAGLLSPQTPQFYCLRRRLTAWHTSSVFRAITPPSSEFPSLGCSPPTFYPAPAAAWAQSCVLPAFHPWPWVLFYSDSWNSPCRWGVDLQAPGSQHNQLPPSHRKRQDLIPRC